MRQLFILFLGLCLLSSSHASDFDMHFFGSIGAARTNITPNRVEYHDVKNATTLTPLTTAGFNISADVNEKTHLLSQFWYTSNDNINIDLMQLRRSFADDFSVRIGKQRLPLFMMSEFIQVHALLPWSVAPRQVYGKVPIYSFTGASLEKKADSLFIQLYAGETSDKIRNTTTDYNVNVRNLFGAKIKYETQKALVYVNAFSGKPHFTSEQSYNVNPVPPVNGRLSLSYDLESFKGFSTGYKVGDSNLYWMTEYSNMQSSSSVLELFETAYTTLGKSLTEDVSFVATFSTDLESRSQISPSMTTSYIGNFVYQLDPSNVLKAGFEHVNYRKKVAQTAFGPTSANLNMTGVPDGNFDVYTLEWAFVY